MPRTAMLPIHRWIIAGSARRWPSAAATSALRIASRSLRRASDRYTRSTTRAFRLPRDGFGRRRRAVRIPPLRCDRTCRFGKIFALERVAFVVGHLSEEIVHCCVCRRSSGRPSGLGPTDPCGGGPIDIAGGAETPRHASFQLVADCAARDSRGHRARPDPRCQRAPLVDAAAGRLAVVVDDQPAALFGKIGETTLQAAQPPLFVAIAVAVVQRVNDGNARRVSRQWQRRGAPALSVLRGRISRATS